MVETFFTQAINNKQLFKRFHIYTLIIIGIISYLPILNHHYFTGAEDDRWVLFENVQVTSLNLDHMKDYFGSFYEGQYSPLNTLVYSIIYYFVQDDPLYYHLLCLSTHIMNSCLVYYVIKRLVKNVGNLPHKGATDRIDSIAFITALIFLINPMQVQSVAWIAASKILLYSLFSLLSILCYIYYYEYRYWHFYFSSIVFFVLSFGFKEQTIVLPLSLLSIDFVLNRNQEVIKCIVEKLPFFTLSLLFAIISIKAQESVFKDRLINDYYPLSQRIVLGLQALNVYIFRTVLPHRLGFYTDFPIKPGETLPITFYALAFIPIILGIFGLLRFNLKKHFIGIWCALFFFINICLTLHIIPMSRYYISDRYVYMSMIGSSLAIALWINKMITNKLTFFKALFIQGAFIVYIGYFIVYTYLYSSTY